ISLFVSFELATVATYAMTAYAKNSRASGEAAIKFFVIGALSAGMILYAISLIYASTGTIAITALDSPLGNSKEIISVAFILLIAGFGFKVAAVPFHLWLPDTYDGAPYSTTTYLSAASKVMGFAALVRIFYVMAPTFASAAGLDWQLIFAVLALLTMTYGNLAALAQTDVKRLLAYSSIAQSGYILIGLALATRFSFAILLYFIMAYAFSKMGSFIAAEFFEREYGAKTLDQYSWIAKTSPVSAFAFSICLLSLAGIPPLSVFVAKFFMFYAAIQLGGAWIWLAVAGVLNSALSLYYYARIIKNMYVGSPSVPVPDQSKLRETPMFLLPLIVTLVLTIGLGLAESPVLGLAAKAMESIRPQFFTQLIEHLISVYR
ncbi:MAG: NADH-quinone oxidoreductase subunit N, partial [Thermoprotei archaeon]